MSERNSDNIKKPTGNKNTGAIQTLKQLSFIFKKLGDRMVIFSID